jgi:hypothetical protein
LETLNVRRRNESHPGPQEHLRSWFENETGRKIDQGTVSRILSSKFAHLDSDTQKPSQLGAKRHYNGEYLSLEQALYEWQQHMQKKNAIIRGDILKLQASEIWRRLPQYRDGIEEEPKWSNGWLQGFKRRFKIKEYVRHGEAGDAAVNTEAAIKQMDDVRAVCATYTRKNTFNMDETGLNWKATPNRSLATEATAGGKKSKDRITLAITSNADGSEKHEHWIIGQSKKPRCFKNVNQKLFGATYRNNKTKWMTGVIYEQFLRDFDRKMRGRKVLLLMDNFSGHELAINAVRGVDSLTNVRIMWLPANTTSKWQPMDQGIIAAFKLHYRKKFVYFMLQELQANRDPNKTVTLLHAIRWPVAAWNEVTQVTIEKCWYKSTCFKKPSIALEEELAIDADIAELQAAIERLRIPADERMNINNFINPPDEAIIDENNDIMESVIERHTIEVEGEESGVSEDEEEAFIPKVLMKEAIKAIELLKLYELQQVDGNRVNIKALDRIGLEVTRRKFEFTNQQRFVTNFDVSVLQARN